MVFSNKQHYGDKSSDKILFTAQNAELIVQKIIFPGQKQLCIVIAVSELTTRVRRCSVLMSTLQIYVAQPPVPDKGFMQRVRI